MEKPADAASFPEIYPDGAIARAPAIPPPGMDDRLVVTPVIAAETPVLRRPAGIAVLLIALCGIGAGIWYGLPGFGWGLFHGQEATRAVVRQIIHVESNGCAGVVNERSTAAGPAQFIEATWLRMIRKHRPDLAGRPRSEILAMRRDRELSREIAARFAEQNARVLRKYGFPITSSTLYLSHFAGVAGAVAILSAPDTADAALTMANADATGRVTRDLIVGANPFLERYTIADLKKWADRKMQREPVQSRNAC